MLKAGANWTCPYCNFPQVLADQRIISGWDKLVIYECVDGDLAYEIEATVCANDLCKKLSLSFSLSKRYDVPNTAGRFKLGSRINSWRLLPATFAKPQPDCVPAPLQTDYYEACAIRDLSPKASATLARRCIQGMIRDFCKITKGRLIDEINELRKQVDVGKAPPGVLSDSVDAIDHVRGIGNIGAHMEKDINVIIDVDPGEAQILIELIETLFAEWYVARDLRQSRIKKLEAIANEKKAAKAAK